MYRKPYMERIREDLAQDRHKHFETPTAPLSMMIKERKRTDEIKREEINRKKWPM